MELELVALATALPGRSGPWRSRFRRSIRGGAADKRRAVVRAKEQWRAVQADEAGQPLDHPARIEAAPWRRGHLRGSCRPAWRQRRVGAVHAELVALFAQEDADAPAAVARLLVGRSMSQGRTPKSWARLALQILAAPSPRGPRGRRRHLAPAIRWRQCASPTSRRCTLVGSRPS